MSFALIASALAGCGRKDIEPDFISHYVYVNESSSEITVHSVVPMEKRNDIEQIFSLPVNNQHTMTLVSRGYPRPFWDALGSNNDYVIISNDTKTVTQRYASRDELYSEGSYTLISEENRVRTMKYVFTDEFF
jgi:hypothetical protein